MDYEKAKVSNIRIYLDKVSIMHVKLFDSGMRVRGTAIVIKIIHYHTLILEIILT